MITSCWKQAQFNTVKRLDQEELDQSISADFTDRLNVGNI
jgi:hypothetical protein